MNKVWLSSEQEKAVKFGNGALLVVAGPGSGKTRVLTERIRRLLSDKNEHFHVLALTFTNKAANEMKERLENNPNISKRTFIGTLHSFCMEMLKQRGQTVGIDGLPNIFNSYQDRKEILLQAIDDDPDLLHEIKAAGDHKAQKERCDEWMRQIAQCKGSLFYSQDVEDEVLRKAYEGYNAKLRASGAVDYDDLLFLAYELLQTRPKVASFYRRLYQYICIDEAQDLNRAQYGVLKALCGDDFSNVMMVGDPKQSIYGFINADPEIMQEFAKDFKASRIELADNYRSSLKVVQAAQGLNPNYQVVGRLPITGSAELIACANEKEEARLIVEKLQSLLVKSHPDIEGKILPNQCAILGRTRYTLLNIEEILREKGIKYYKSLSATHEYETDIVSELIISMRILVNPKDKLHLNQLKTRWRCAKTVLQESTNLVGILKIEELSKCTDDKRSKVILEACKELVREKTSININSTLDLLGEYANTLEDDEKREIWEDIAVMKGEWDRYLRGKIGSQSDLQSFLAHIALGTTQQMYQEGVALLTVHASKGLEFDVVFLVGMSEGVFPDYRAQKNQKMLDEEKRNAFVAVSRSKRLLYVSYPRQRTMPWGDIWPQNPSRFINAMNLAQ